MGWGDPFLLSRHPAFGLAGRSGRRGRPWPGSCGGAGRGSGGPGSRSGRIPAWRSGSERFGSWKGARNRLRRWAADGTGEKVFAALLAQADAEGDLDWVVAVDSTIVRAHQHGAGACQEGPRPASRQTMPSVDPAVD
jgi:hypothetical protein